MRCNKVYACWALNDEIHQNSTSGGIFSILAMEVLNKGGSVYGAAFNEDFTVEHIRVTNIKELSRIRGSKYVASMAYKTYYEVKKDLDNDMFVLFSGTPCQVAALKNTLGRKYEKLICVDLVCHGVVTPKLWKDYLYNIESMYGSKIARVNFRYKKPSWPSFSMYIELVNHKELVRDKRKDPYLLLFLNELSMRPSCHNCCFTSINREGDITIGDFWGIIPKNELEKQHDKGISLCLLNTEKGQEFFDSVKKQIYWEEHSIDEAIQGNRCFSEPYPSNSQRANFFADYAEYGYDYVVKKYCVAEKIPIKTRLRESNWFKPFLERYRTIRGKKNA